MRIRTENNANYRAIFFEGKTIRQRINASIPISSPAFAEIEDVAINNKCFGNCPYCYTSAVSNGKNFDNIVDKAYEVWGKRSMNDRPFQIAIGGVGESTLHPDWIEFVKAVNSLGIMPNYTTNGMHLTENLLLATEKYCGGVAISFHPHMEHVFHKAIAALSELKTVLNVHVVIGDEESLVNLKRLYIRYQKVFKHFVLLPYKAVGRAVEIETYGVWDNMFKWITSLDRTQHEKFAYGANFYDYLKEYKPEIEVDIYEPEMYSGYRIFDDTFMNLRYSSYNLNFK
jgi:MoaA/NifB/PqqE/SkfB family radical SAM enzyme